MISFFFEFPLPKVSLCQVWWISGSGEEDENVKSLQIDGRTDMRTTGDQKISLEQFRWSKSIFGILTYLVIFVTNQRIKLNCLRYFDHVTEKHVFFQKILMEDTNHFYDFD